MPEWLNGTVSKTVYRLVRYEGSNPSLSARQKQRPRLKSGAILFRSAAPACGKQCAEIKMVRHEVPALFLGLASPTGIAEGNPSLSADKFKRLQVVEFEGVFLFE
jgi:hypothetical protein